MRRIGWMICFLLTLPMAATKAQPGTMEQKITEWYLEERFLIADQNDDALLEKRELAAMPREFAYYLEGTHYGLTDINQDGFLSYYEIVRRFEAEQDYRYYQERSRLRQLEQEYPDLRNPTVAYLKQHPRLVAELFAQYSWMVQHSALAEQVYKDEAWTSLHPEVLIALHKNLRWLAARPLDARNIYRDRKTIRQMPQFLAWRADHQAFIRQHALGDKFYQLDLLPREIQLNRR